MTHPEHLRHEDAGKLYRLRERDPELDRITRHVRKFAVMMTARRGDRLEDWITEVERDSLAPLADAGYQGLGAQTGGRVVTPPHRKFKKNAPDWY